jgi:hypothetical protein
MRFGRKVATKCLQQNKNGIPWSLFPFFRYVPFNHSFQMNSIYSAYGYY